VSRRAKPSPAGLVGLLWVSPWLIGFLAFMLLPMAMSLYYSCTDYNMLEAPLWVGPANYRRMFTDGVFGAALKNTALYGNPLFPLPVSAFGVTLPHTFAPKGRLLGDNYICASHYYNSSLLLPRGGSLPHEVCYQ